MSECVSCSYTVGSTSLNLDLNEDLSKVLVTANSQRMQSRVLSEHLVVP